jgi:predicted glycosyltransferase
MKLIIDIGHPAHVHLFKNFARSMQEKNHSVLFTCREKEMTEKLLAHYNFQYVSLGKPYSNMIGKIKGLYKFNALLFKTARTFKPDMFLSHGSMYAAHVSSMLRKPHISMEDTGNKEQVRLYKLFTDVILTSTSFKQDLGKKQFRYNGYHELAYLHPDTFTPDQSIRDKLGLADGQPYVIMRFVSWGATHDVGHDGISLENKIRTVNEFSKYAKVFISSETALPAELEPYSFHIGPEHMHDAMAFAALLYGESGTMASESAMLGVPAVYLDNTGRYYTTELQEKYGLVFNFSESPEDQEKALNKGIELLKNPGTENGKEWQERWKKMLNDNIDVTAFLVWFVENYPQSKTMNYESSKIRR